MIYTDFKLLNLYYILLDLFPNNDETYIRYNPEIGIRVITKDLTLSKKIENIDYFINNNFYIKYTDSIDFSKHLFYINICNNQSLTIYNDFIYLSKQYKLNIILISEKCFIIENGNTQLIKQIINKYLTNYNYKQINNKFIFMIKN